MAVLELVIVPARPGGGDWGLAEFEVRVGADGRAMLPAFSSVAVLVRELGCCQPWVCVPWRLAEEAASRAGLASIVLDPVVGTSAERWTAANLTHRYGEPGVSE